jgi:hypothetical protein
LALPVKLDLVALNMFGIALAAYPSSLERYASEDSELPC